MFRKLETAYFLAVFGLCQIGALLYASPLMAQQNSMVIGAQSFARECYERSQLASQNRSANRRDIEVCNRAIFSGRVVNDELAATYANRGVIHMAMKNVKNAYKDYQRAIEINPRLPEAYINRGNLWYFLQQYQRAIDDFNTALKLDSAQQTVIYLNRGLVYEAKGALISAEQDYKKALTLNPKLAAAQDKLQRVEDKLKKQNDDQSTN